MESDWRLLTEPGAKPIWFGTAAVVENTPIGREMYALRILSPPIARSILPGQFVMVRLPGHYDPLLGRAFALFDVFPGSEEGEPQGLEIVYTAVGKMTRLLARSSPGQTVEVWGPLGNGFPVPSRPVLLMVAGGIGYTPFMAVAQEATGRRRYGVPARPVTATRTVKLLFGVRSAASLPSDLSRFEGIGTEVHIISDDGSTGRRGLVSDLLEEQLRMIDPNQAAVFCCGPEAMMEKVAAVCEAAGTPCYVSLETPMACGLGLCYSCVVRLKDESRSEGWDFHRVCVDGPVFEAKRVLFR